MTPDPPTPLDRLDALAERAERADPSGDIRGIVIPRNHLRALIDVAQAAQKVVTGSREWGINQPLLIAALAPLLTPPDEEPHADVPGSGQVGC